MGLNGRVGKIGARLQMLISKKESGESGEKELLDGGGKRTRSLLNLAPTKVESKIALMVKDIRLKVSMTQRPP
jgi:hypothetical protein